MTTTALFYAPAYVVHNQKLQSATSKLFLYPLWSPAPPNSLQPPSPFPFPIWDFTYICGKAAKLSIFFSTVSHWIKACFSRPACYDFKDSSLHLALSTPGASVGLTDTPALKLMAVSGPLPWGAHLGKKKSRGSLILNHSGALATHWMKLGHEKRDCFTIQAHRRANENMLYACPVLDLPSSQVQ